MTKCGCVACDCNIVHADKVKKAKKGMLSDDVIIDMADF